MLSLYSNKKQQPMHDPLDEKEEVESLRHQVTALKESLRATRERNATVLREQRESEQEARNEIESLNTQIEMLKKKFAQQQQKHGADLEKALMDKDATIANLRAEVDALHKQKQHDDNTKNQALQETMVARAASEEAEEHLKIAHQHLSKKVRETTELTERLVALQSNLEHVNAQIFAKNEALNTLEQSVKISEAKEHALLKELHDQKKAYEAKQAEWQSKISVIQRDLEQERAENERMRVYEERCHQIARYWDSMGKVLWNKRSSEDLRNNVMTNTPQGPRPYQNLYDLPSSAHTTAEDHIGEQ